MRRTLYTLTLMACILCMSLDAFAQRISHTYNNVSLSEALLGLNNAQDEYVVNFLYNELEDFRITATIKNKKLPDAIQQMIGFYPVRMTVKPYDHEIYVECTHKTDRHLTGTIIDEQDQPVAYANIAILNPADSTLLSGGVSNESGYFAIPYELPTVLARISFVGYKTIYKICEQPKVGTIRMQVDNYDLKGVVVKGHRPTYKMEGTELVASIQGTILSELGFAPDVLRQLPFVNVSGKEISIVGRGTPVIYINNRKMRGEFELERIPAKMIKDIKIDMLPGARYDATVTAVIHITTIQPAGEGLGGQISTFHSLYNDLDFLHNLGSVYLNNRKGKTDIFLYAVYQYTNSKLTAKDDYQFTLRGDDYQIKEEEDRLDRFNASVIQGGLNHQLTEKQSLGVLYTFKTKWDYSGIHDNDNIFTVNEVDEAIHAHSHSNDRETSHWVNSYYSTMFSEDCSLMIDATYRHGGNHSRQQQTEDHQGVLNRFGSVTNRSDNLYAMEAVVTNNLWKGKLTWGAEWNLTNSKQDYRVDETLSTAVSSSLNESKQQMIGAFVTYKLQTGPVSTTMGGRYELADYSYRFNGSKSQEDRTYSDFFPSLSFTYSAKGFSSTLGYKVRILRPAYSDLRSGIYYASSYSYEEGNPTLRPTFDHHLSSITNWKDIQFMIDYHDYHDASDMVFSLYKGTEPILYHSCVNYDYKKIGAAVAYSPTFGFWKPTLSINLAKQFLNYGGTQHNDPVFGYSWKNLFSLPKQWVITCSVNGESAGYSGTWYSMPMFDSDINVEKRIGNWRMSFSASDLFHTRYDDGVVRTNGVSNKHWGDLHSNTFSLTVTYTFNPTRSRYKGGSAGQSEINRL